MLPPFGTGRVDLAIVKALALVRIAQQIIGRSDFLELVFGGVITRIKIRMQFLRQLPICLLDVGRRSSGRNAKKLVRICHDLHRLACGCALGLVSPEKHEVIAAQVADRSVSDLKKQWEKRQEARTDLSRSASPCVWMRSGPRQP